MLQGDIQNCLRTLVFTSLLLGGVAYGQTALDFGVVVTGNITVPNEVHTYTFDVDNGIGQQVIVRMSEPQSSTFTPDLTVFDPDGTEVGSVNNQSVTAEIVFDVTMAGIYTIWAKESGGNQVGSYELIVQRSRNPGNAMIIVHNDVVPGNMPSFGELHTFTFDGQQGEEVNLWLAGAVSSNFSPQLYIFDPNGTLIGSDVSSFLAEFHATLADSGSHTIWVTESGGNNTGSYVLSFSDAVVDVAENQDTIPAHFGLAQNYPNPFNPSTTIRYQLPVSGSVRLEIFNVAGHRIRTLLDSATKEAGVHAVEWDGTNDQGIQTGSGLYIYRIRVGGFQEVKRMMLIK